jgi:hypothetical protein
MIDINDVEYPDGESQEDFVLDGIVSIRWATTLRPPCRGTSSIPSSSAASGAGECR